MKKRYSEEQIIKAIKRHETGTKVDDICRDMAISSVTFYNWHNKSERVACRRKSMPIGINPV